jgi:hypothetical protein
MGQAGREFPDGGQFLDCSNCSKLKSFSRWLRLLSYHMFNRENDKAASNSEATA